jgi:hypothetical protein
VIEYCNLSFWWTLIICCYLGSNINNHYLLCNEWGNLALTSCQKCQCQLMIRIVGITTIVNNHLHELLLLRIHHRTDTLTSRFLRQKMWMWVKLCMICCALLQLCFLFGSFIIAETAANETRGLVLFKGVLQCYLLHSLPPDTNSNHHLGDKWKW